MNFSNQEIPGRILQRRMFFLGLLDLKIILYEFMPGRPGSVGVGLFLFQSP